MEKLFCPDCGGVLGSTEPGEAPCSCFKNDPGSADTHFGDASPEPSLYDTEPVAELTKLCVSCGKNVAGHRRFKDSRGYLCLACKEAEREAEKAGTFACAECSRRVKPAGLVDYRGLRICRLCYNDHKTREKTVFRPVPGKAFEKDEKGTLKVLVIILCILGVFIILSIFKMRH